MKCFYHPETEAVGLCKNCQRGLCPQCLTEYKHGLACKGRCEAVVSFKSGKAEIKINAQHRMRKWRQRRTTRERKPWSHQAILLIIVIALAAILYPVFRYRQRLANPLDRRYIDISLLANAVTLAIPLALRMRRKRWLFERGLTEEES